MKKVEILIAENDLNKLEELGIKYTITNPDVELENLFRCSNHTCELNNYEMEQIIEKAKEAISKGKKYGIVIDVNLGRDMNDERCYSLEKVYVDEIKNGWCNYTVEELLKHV
tara:strand:+ start:584 stop:919 length:336 start_codon:yes stop_codon:yes gene_type:complete